MNAPTQDQVHCGYCGWQNKVNSQALEKVQLRCSRCKLPLSSHKQAYFKHLDPAVYMHPTAAEALQQLKNLPGIQNLLTKMQALGEQSFGEAFFAANGLRVSANQYPDLYGKLLAVCRIMGIQQMPALYLSHVDIFGDMGLYSYSGGSEAHPFIVISPQMLSVFDEQDLLAAMATEIGHIHCGHMRYKVAADCLPLIMHKAFKKTPLETMAENISLPVQQALLTWRLKAGLSADRTMMLVLQNEKAGFNYLLKQAGGTVASRASLEAFILQAQQLNQGMVNQWLEKYWQQFLYSHRVFPFPVWRAAELLQWTREDKKGYGYKDIVKIFSD